MLSITTFKGKTDTGYGSIATNWIYLGSVRSVVKRPFLQVGINSFILSFFCCGSYAPKIRSRSAPLLLVAVYKVLALRQGLTTVSFEAERRRFQGGTIKYDTGPLLVPVLERSRNKNLTKTIKWLASLGDVIRVLRRIIQIKD